MAQFSYQLRAAGHTIAHRHTKSQETVRNHKDGPRPEGWAEASKMGRDPKGGPTTERWAETPDGKTLETSTQVLEWIFLAFTSLYFQVVAFLGIGW